jgi:hypothetical protein
VQSEIPNISQLETFVEIIDTHLLMVISKKNNKLLYRQWVKFNAKAAKTLLVTMKRSAQKQSTRTSKPKATKVAALTKPPTKRTPPTIELEDNPRATAKRAMARKASNASASVPGAAAGSEEGPSAASARAPTSEEGPSAASARAPTQNADSSGGASSGSGMAPPSCTSAVDSDADLVEEVEFAFKCKGEAVIEAAGEVECMICHLPIKADDLVVVNAAEKVRHEMCMSVAAAVDCAGKIPPLPPFRAREIKKNKKALRAATAAASKKPPLPGVSADAALKRHDALMNLAKTMAKTGESNGDTWRLRYEPTKRGSWLNTRHAVVLRWANGTCKTHQFAFAEMEMGDEAFTVAFDKAVTQVVNLGKE